MKNLVGDVREVLSSDLVYSTQPAQMCNIRFIEYDRTVLKKAFYKLEIPHELLHLKKFGTDVLATPIDGDLIFRKLTFENVMHIGFITCVVCSILEPTSITT